MARALTAKKGAESRGKGTKCVSLADDLHELRVRAGRD
jgi:hypothetical protein